MNEFDAYYLRALKYLQIRARSEKEIRDYLLRHSGKRSAARIKEGSWTSRVPYGNPASQDDSSFLQLVDLIILKLKEQKFLNDEEFAVSWIRSRTKFKPKGERLIRLELQQKGINKDTIDKAFEEFDNDQVKNNENGRDELVLAKEILERKRKKFAPMDRGERFNKAGSLLARRGFGLDTIKKAIEETFEK